MSSNRLKIVLFGDAKVGKTALCQRLMKNNQFYEKYTETVGGNHFNKNNLLINAVQLALSIWDVAGNKRYHIIAEEFLKDADILILCFNLRKDSLSLASLNTTWLKIVEDFNAKQPPNKKPVHIVIMGLQSDLHDAMTEQQACDQLKAMQLDKYPYFTVSAKKNINVLSAFTQAVASYQDQTDKIIDPRADTIKAGLQEYVNKVHANYAKKKSFNYGFFPIGSENRAINREINYRLTKRMLEELNDQQLTNTIMDDSEIIQLRAEIIAQVVIEHKNANPKFAYKPTTIFNKTGINSNKLNKAITDARKSVNYKSGK